MAWRNLWRSRRRTLITAFTVAFGVLLSVSFTASGDYSYTEVINTSARMGTGHLTVEAPGYNDNPTLDKRVPGAGEIRARVLELPGATDAVVRIMGQAMFSSAAKSLGGIFIALDPAGESPGINFFLDSIEEGELFEGTGGRGAVIGSKMAEKLNIGIGRKLVYTATDATGEIVGEVARVEAVFRTGVDEVDSTFVLLPIDRVRETLKYTPDEASLVAVFIDDQRNARAFKDVLEKEIGPGEYEVLTWDITQPDMAGFVTIDRGFNYLFQLLIGLLIAAGILNTILMSVLERRREFGVMMAVGTSPARLTGLVLMESIMIGLLGLMIGTVLTIPWYAYMSTTGILFESLEGANIGMVPMEPVIKFRLYFESAVAILAGIFALTLVAGLYPAIKASRVAPVESLKYG